MKRLFRSIGKQMQSFGKQRMTRYLPESNAASQLPLPETWQAAADEPLVWDATEAVADAEVPDVEAPVAPVEPVATEPAPRMRPASDSSVLRRAQEMMPDRIEYSSRPTPPDLAAILDLHEKRDAEARSKRGSGVRQAAPSDVQRAADEGETTPTPPPRPRRRAIIEEFSSSTTPDTVPPPQPAAEWERELGDQWEADPDEQANPLDQALVDTQPIEPIAAEPSTSNEQAVQRSAEPARQPRSRPDAPAQAQSYSETPRPSAVESDANTAIPEPDSTAAELLDMLNMPPDTPVVGLQRTSEPEPAPSVPRRTQPQPDAYDDVSGLENRDRVQPVQRQPEPDTRPASLDMPSMEEQADDLDTLPSLEGQEPVASDEVRWIDTITDEGEAASTARRQIDTPRSQRPSEAMPSEQGADFVQRVSTDERHAEGDGLQDPEPPAIQRARPRSQARPVARPRKPTPERPRIQRFVEDTEDDNDQAFSAVDEAAELTVAPDWSEADDLDGERDDPVEASPARQNETPAPRRLQRSSQSEAQPERRIQRREQSDSRSVERSSASTGGPSEARLTPGRPYTPPAEPDTPLLQSDPSPLADEPDSFDEIPAQPVALDAALANRSAFVQRQAGPAATAVMDADYEALEEPMNDDSPSIQPMPLDAAFLSRDAADFVDNAPDRTEPDFFEIDDSESGDGIPLQRIALDEAVMREAAAPAAGDASNETASNESESSDEADQKEEENVNIEKLARDVYDRLRDKLRVEQERRSGRK